MRKANRWTEQEVELFKRLWQSDASIDDIIKAFPRHTVSSLYAKAVILRVHRP